MVEMCTREIAIDCVRKHPNRRAALIEFMSRISHGEEDQTKLADRMVQATIDLFDPHLSDSIKFNDLVDSAYGAVLVSFSAGVAHFGSNLKAAGYLDDGLNIKEKAPVAESAEVQTSKIDEAISESGKRIAVGQIWKYQDTLDSYRISKIIAGRIAVVVKNSTNEFQWNLSNGFEDMVLVQDNPIAESVGDDATQIEVENGKVRLFISEHKFGAYPTCSTLLSNNHDRQVRQIMSVMDQDRKLDSCEGAWDYYTHEVQVPSRVSNSDAA